MNRCLIKLCKSMLRVRWRHQYGPRVLLLVALLAFGSAGCDSSIRSNKPADGSPSAEQDAIAGSVEAGKAVSAWREVTPEEKTTPLIAALLDRNWDRFEQLLYNGADPNEWDQYGRNAVLVAAGIPNSQNWLRYSLFHGGDPHARSPEKIDASPLLGGGFAPLHMAACLSENELNVRILVEAGADVNAQNAYGMTPLGLAVGGRLYEVAAYLVDNGAEVDAKGEGGFSIREQISWIGTDDDAFILSSEDASSLTYLRERIAKSDAAKGISAIEE